MTLLLAFDCDRRWSPFFVFVAIVAGAWFLMAAL